MGKNDVYLWSEAPLRPAERQPVPPAADVVIVGAGYTGLSAAIRLARAGRSVQVMTGGPPSGKIVSRLVLGQAPEIDVTPYTAGRFQRRGAALERGAG